MDGENYETRRFLPIRAASHLTGLNAQTLRKFADAKKVKCYRTPSGQRRFDRHSLEAMCDLVDVDEGGAASKKCNVIYARVSSKKQLDDLSRQIQFLQSSDSKYASYDTISDVASGINFKRKGLSSILDACIQGNIGEIVVAHRDRLCRFGFDLIQRLVEKAGGKITVLDDNKNKSTEQELSEDLLSIVHIYCCRQMGKRSYDRKRSGGDNVQSISLASVPDASAERSD